MGAPRKDRDVGAALVQGRGKIDRGSPGSHHGDLAAAQGVGRSIYDAVRYVGRGKRRQRLRDMGELAYADRDHDALCTKRLAVFETQFKAVAIASHRGDSPGVEVGYEALLERFSVFDEASLGSTAFSANASFCSA